MGCPFLSDRPDILLLTFGKKARLIRAGDMKDKVIQEALVIVQDHAEMLAEAWEKIHGE